MHTWSSDKACDCDILGNRFFSTYVTALVEIQDQEGLELG